MKRVVLFGGTGQLGQALQKDCAGHYAVIAPTSREVSFERAESVERYIERLVPDIVVNAAAYTRVDEAEFNRERAFLVNSATPRAIATASLAVGARFVHISTDYVFDGTGALPYAPLAPTNPLNVYGESKLSGELAVAEENPKAVIVRTGWLHSGSGTNFVGTAVRLLSAGTSMRVVDDQVGTPTRAANLSQAVLAIVEAPSVSGILHVTDAGVASWYDVACCVLETLRLAGRLPADTTVTPVSTRAFPRPARRPPISILDTHESRTRLTWIPPHWRDGVIASTIELLNT